MADHRRLLKEEASLPHPSRRAISLQAPVLCSMQGSQAYRSRLLASRMPSSQEGQEKRSLSGRDPPNHPHKKGART